MSARLTVSEVDTRAETITLTGTRDNLRRVENWLHGDVDVVPAGTVEKLQAENSTVKSFRVSCPLCGWTGTVGALKAEQHGHCPECGEHL